MSDQLDQELLFLICQTLSERNLKTSLDSLLNEISTSKHAISLPHRNSYDGASHPLSFSELQCRLPHSTSRLSDILSRLLESSNLNSLLSSRMDFNSKNISNFSPSLDSPLSGNNIASLQRSNSLGRFQNPKNNSFINSNYELCVSVRGHTGAVYSTLFDLTGSRFITGGDDNLIKIWCASTGWLIHSIRGLCGFNISEQQVVVTDLAISRDNEYLASASSDGFIRVFKMADYSPKYDITEIKFSGSIREGNLCLSSTCGDGSCRKWTHLDGKFPDKSLVEIKPSSINFKIKSTSYNETGTRLAIARDDGFVYLYSMFNATTYSDEKYDQSNVNNHFRKEPLLLAILMHEEPIIEVVFSFRGDRLISSSKDGLVKIWSFSTESLSWVSTTIDVKSEIERFKLVTPVLEIPNSISKMRQSKRTQIQEEQPVAEEAIRSPIENAISQNFPESIAPIPNTFLSPIEQAIAQNFPTQQAPTADANIAPIQQNPSSRLLPDTSSTATCVHSIEWSRDDQFIFATSRDFNLRIWSANTGELLSTFTGHTNEVYILASHPICPHIVMTGSYDGLLIFWDIQRKIEMNRIQTSSNGSILCAEWFHDGTKIIVSDHNGEVHLIQSNLDSQQIKTRFAKTPKIQFFRLDWEKVFFDRTSGQFRDERTNIPTWKQNLGLVCDAFLEPYAMQNKSLVSKRRNRLKKAVFLQAEDDGDFLEGMLNRKFEVEYERKRLELRALFLNELRDLSLEELCESPIENLKELNRRKRVFKPTRPSTFIAYEPVAPVVPFIEWDNPNDSDYDVADADADADGEEEEEVVESIFIINDDDEDGADVISAAGPSYSKPAMVRRTRSGSGSSSSVSQKVRRKPKKRRRRLASDDDEGSLDFIDSRSDTDVDESLEGITRSGKRRREKSPDSPPLQKRSIKNNRVTYVDSSSSDVSNDSDLVKTHAETSAASRVIVKDLTLVNPPLPQPPKKVVFKVVQIPLIESWVTEDTVSPAKYIPQLGDLIVYFRQGHFEFLQKSKFKKFTHPEKFLVDNFGDVFFGIVKKIEWQTNELNSPNCRLGIEVYFSNFRLVSGINGLLVGQLPVINNNTVFSNELVFVDYWEEPYLDSFIVLDEKFRKGNSQIFVPNQRYVRCTEVQEIKGPVFYSVNLQNIDYSSIWGMIKCLPVSEDNIVIGEIISVNFWNLRFFLPDFTSNEIIPDQENKRLIKIIQETIDNEVFGVFVSEVEYDAYPTYLLAISYPVYLDLISRKLKNRVYRRPLAVLYDISTMRYNAMLFNEKGSHVYEFAKVELLKLMQAVCIIPDWFSVVDEVEDIPCPVVKKEVVRKAKKKPASKRRKKIESDDSQDFDVSDVSDDSVASYHESEDD